MAKILVADDNSNIQKMVGLALKDQGIDVVAVGNGEAAVRKISDIRPDLVLADVFMPVRNGYEVCRYVKEDSSLAHIPVILLVGAFDPLDEQEAQRVGADGVLKKPFVPPDPLISMVKSALQRAGIPLGPATAAPEKAPAMPKRSTADLLSGGMGTKLTPVVSEKLPEISPEPLEEFPSAAPHLKIAAGSEPLAFGSLLDTSDSEDMAITAKPMINLSQGSKWSEEEDEVEEEKEEGEETGDGWRPGGLDEAIERVTQPEVAIAPDWRDEAFHGNPPAKSFPATPWVPAAEQPEAAESHSIAVATAPKPADSPVPFAGDAWAAAMAAGVEDKLAEVVAPVTPVVPEAEAAPEVHAAATQEAVADAAPEVREQLAEQIPDVAPGIDQGARVADSAARLFEQPAVSEPANWAAAPEMAWESEAKKAALLASTWDAPKPFSVDETQEVPAYAAEPVAEQAEALLETPAEESPYSAELIAAHEAEERVEGSVSETVVASEAAVSEVETGAGLEAAEAKTLQTWEPAAPVAAETHAEEPVAEEPRMEAHVEAPHVEGPVAVAPQVEEQVVATAPAETPVAEPEAAKQAEPDMDELVARVLGKMNPEVLQRVTREILKPVIEAIVRDEINSKKS
ncbi:MAG: response regulator [Candidatus Acidiferrum sp.]